MAIPKPTNRRPAPSRTGANERPAADGRQTATPEPVSEYATTRSYGWDRDGAYRVSN